MPRPPRVDLGEYVYHVINRSNGRARFFHNDADFADFEYLLHEVKETFEMRILAYVLMPNHWHLLLYPRADGDLSESMHWLCTSHARRHHTRKETIGNGHLYQGRYKSFLVENDTHLLTVLKYIERNPVRARLALHPSEWKWGSAFRRLRGSAKQKLLLCEPPVDLPRDYREWIKEPEPAEETETIRICVNKGNSYGMVVLPKE